MRSCRSLLPILATVVACAAGAACSSSDDPASPPADGGAGGGDSGSNRDGGAGFDSDTSSDGGSGAGDASEGGLDDGATATLTLTSPAFAAGGVIPATHSCDGAGTSIPLAWSGAPAGTESFAVVMRDLTLANNTNYHWVIWDIPAAATSLAAGIANVANPDPPGGGAKQTKWSFGEQLGYGNMCPTAGPSTHEYELVVYALPAATLALQGATGPNATHARIDAEQLTSASLKGSYTKQ
jgi:Raf kinase inhibitor-like YbhB/YbcL family protein